MNNSTIDHLLAVPPQRPESSLAPVRPRGDFNSHFRRAGEASEQQPPRKPANAAAERPLPPKNESAPKAEACPVCDDELDANEQSKSESDVTAAGEASLAAAVATPPAKNTEAESKKPAENQALHLATEGQQKLAGENAAEDVPPPILPGNPHKEKLGSETKAEAVPVMVDDALIDAEAAPVDSARKSTAPVATDLIVASQTLEPVPAVPAEETVDTTEVAAESDAPQTQAAQLEDAESHLTESQVQSKSSKSTVEAAVSVPQVETANEPRQAQTASTKATVEASASIAVAAAEEPADGETSEQAVEGKSTASEKEPASSRLPTSAGNRAPTATTAIPIAVSAPQTPPAIEATTKETSEAETKTQAVKPAAKESLLSPFARLERGGPQGPHSNRASGEHDVVSRVDPARFVSRVARAVQTAHERGGPLQLRLSPPELGNLRLEITMRGGALTASIETDNAHARQLLLENLPALRDRLAEQSVRIERFDVDVRRDGTNDGNGGRPNSGPQERGQQRHHDSSPRHNNTGRGTTNQSSSDAPSPVRRTITNTSINVIA